MNADVDMTPDTQTLKRGNQMEVPISARSLKLQVKDKEAIEENILESSILVVDDNQTNARLVKVILASEGFKNVHTETQPKNVNSRIRNLKPDLMILDLIMPEVSGAEIMKLLGAGEVRDFDGPIIALTADLSPETRRMAFEHGADDYLCKPVDSAEICVRVCNLLAGYILRKQLERQNSTLQEMVEVRTALLEQTNASLELEMGVRKEADTLLQKAEQRLRFLLTSSPSTIYSAKSEAPHDITFMSDNVKALLGYSSEDFVSNSGLWRELTHPDDMVVLAAELPTMLARKFFSVQVRICHKDRSYRWIRSDVVVISNADGTPSELVGSWLDVTDRKLSDEALAKTATELSAANSRLLEFDRVKSEFVSTASHEMRTPLTVIREFANLLSDGAAGSEPEEQAECFEAILRNCDRLTGMLDYLLDFQRMEAGKLTLRRSAVNVGEILNRCHKDLSPKCTNHTLGFKLEVSNEFPAVLADDEQVMQVLVNLIGNSVKFTPIGGSNTLTASQADAFGRITVEDTGRGIAPENLESIFEAFRQIDRVDGPGFRGTGLGLTISNRIVSMHGGSLSVESTVGKGTKFSFTLPEWTEARALEALVNDKWEDCAGSVYLVSITLDSHETMDEQQKRAALSELETLTKASLRTFDGGTILPDRGCIAFVMDCDKLGIESAVERLSQTLPTKLVAPATISFRVVEITERHNAAEMVLAASASQNIVVFDSEANLESC